MKRFLMPWRRRLDAAEEGLSSARSRLQAAHDDWVPLADVLGQIEREIDLNDWTLTARHMFLGRG